MCEARWRAKQRALTVFGATTTTCAEHEAADVYVGSHWSSTGAHSVRGYKRRISDSVTVLDDALCPLVAVGHDAHRLAVFVFRLSRLAA